MGRGWVEEGPAASRAAQAASHPMQRRLQLQHTADKTAQPGDRQSSSPSNCRSRSLAICRSFTMPSICAARQHRNADVTARREVNAGVSLWSPAGLPLKLCACTAPTSHEPAWPPPNNQPPHPAHLAGELRAALLLEAGQQALLMVLASCSTCEGHGARPASSSERQPGCAVQEQAVTSPALCHTARATASPLLRYTASQLLCPAPCPPLVACSRRRASFLR